MLRGITMRFAPLASFAPLLALVACSSPTSGPDGSLEDVVADHTAADATPGTDAGQDATPSPDATANDATTGDVTTSDATGNDATAGDAAMPTDASTTDAGPSPCGTQRPSVGNITGTEGLVIAVDGTIYYSQRGFVGRLRLGGTPENHWVATGAASSTIWGIALDVPHHRLYVGNPSSGQVFTIDLTAATPTAVALSFSAGQPNGLTMGPDGAMYYSDFGGGHVYRVDDAGARTRVTTSVIHQANGVAFGSDGRLYVDSYGDGTVVALTLSGGMETARAVVATGLGNPDGLAFDAIGRIYVTNNSAGILYRVNADGTNRTMLASGLPAAANIEFGAGPLNCRDIYVANSGPLGHYMMGDQPGADVPWHH
jgi:sugar lactone lactonase YvrE